VSARQYCSFRLNRLLFGIDVQLVQEVLMDFEVTRVPLAAAIVRGLINLRGQIITAIDLRVCLGFSGDDSRRPVSMIVRTREGMMSFQVDAMEDVVEVDAERFEELPGTSKGVGTELIEGVYKTDGQLLHVLDCDRVLEVILSRSVENVRHGAN
jgi:purine-binding chemotaxis protein CheW